MDRIEFRAELLYLGTDLPVTVRDDGGQVLLVKGQKIETRLQLAGIQSRQCGDMESKLAAFGSQ